MRKSKMQQKNEAGQQLKLFAWQAGEPTGTPTGGTSMGTLTGVELLSLLERQRTLTENLLEKIVDYGNLIMNLNWFAQLGLQSLYLKLKV